jgi:hypothetical protein
MLGDRMTVSSTTGFAALVRDFCLWAEGPASEPDVEVRTALRFLAGLYSAALDLEAEVDWSHAPDRPSDEEWQIIYKRFRGLPVGYYSECLDPTKVPCESQGAGDIADDLADIWQDLKGGLLLHDSGNADAAVVHWHQTFALHWGHHAASALYILDYWLGRE